MDDAAASLLERLVGHMLTRNGFQVSSNGPPTLPLLLCPCVERCMGILCKYECEVIILIYESLSLKLFCFLDYVKNSTFQDILFSSR